MATSSTSTHRLRAISGFAAFGAFWGAWGALLPDVRANAHATNGSLGVALLAVGVGALTGMRLTGDALDRFGGRAAGLALAAFAVATTLPALAGSPYALGAALFIVGVTSGATDVALNTLSADIETADGRPLLNLAHAAFSGAVVVTSLGVAVTAAAREHPAAAFVVVALVIVAAAWAVRVTMPIARRSRSPRNGRTSTRASRPPDPPARASFRPSRYVLVIGALGAAALLVENAWQTWSAVHLRDTLEAGSAVAAAAPGAFAAAAAGGRAAGNQALNRVGHGMLVRIGAVTAATGSLVAALAPTTWLALTGIVVAGAGTSVCYPTLLGMAGRFAPPAMRGRTVSDVVAVSYLGFVIGPAIIGLVADVANLRVALMGPAVLAVAVAVLAPAVARTGFPPARGRDVPIVELVALTPEHPLRTAVMALRPLADQEQFSSFASETLPDADTDLARTPFAIVHDGQPVGFGVLDRAGVLAELTNRPSRSVLLRAFYIAGGDQGHGLGSAAVRELPALAALIAPNARTMLLTVNVANPVAARLYVAAGFVDTGRRYLRGGQGPQYVLALDLVAARRRISTPH